MAEYPNAIELHDAKGVVRFRVLVRDDGTASLSLNDSDGRERIILWIGADGNGAIAVRDENGNSRVGIGATPESGAGMTVVDPNEDSVLNLRILGDAAPLSLHRQDHTFMWPYGLRPRQ